MTPERLEEIRAVLDPQYAPLSRVMAEMSPASSIALYDHIRDAISELLDEIDRLRALQEWRPIETAPRDGTPILAYYKIRNADGDEAWVVPAIAVYWLPVQWVNFETGGKLKVQPTHWMPLPNPPEVRE